MKKLNLFGILFISVLTFSACSSDDDNIDNAVENPVNNEDPNEPEEPGEEEEEEDPAEEISNHFTYDGSEIEIVDSLLEYGEPFPQTESHIVTLMMTNSTLSGSDYQPEDPVFSAVVFGIFTGSSNDLEVGTYTYSQTGAVGTYAIAAVALDLELDNENPDNVKEVTSGTLTVEENGDEYAIYFNGFTNGGTPVSLHFEGAINNKIGFSSDSRMSNPETPTNRLMKAIRG